MYFDVNSLYGYAMSQSLPIGNYKWVDVTNEVINEILNVKEDGNTGYMLEVDMHYPKKITCIT